MSGLSASDIAMLRCVRFGLSANLNNNTERFRNIARNLCIRGFIIEKNHFNKRMGKLRLYELSDKGQAILNLIDH